MKAEIDKFVIQKVRERRLELGLTQEQLSYALNRAASFISNKENGTEFYNVKHLNEIAIVLKCSIKDFFPDKPIKE